MIQKRVSSSRISMFLLFLFAIVFFGAIIGHGNDSYSNLMSELTPWVLLSVFLIVILQLILSPLRTRQEKKAILQWLIICLLFTYIVELIGVKTGKIFGSYDYNETTLGLTLLGVPLTIGLNWSVIIMSLAETMRASRVVIMISILMTTILAVLFDIVLEPVAVNLKYWNWTDGRIPIQNYFAWGIIVFFSSTLYFWIVPDPGNRKRESADKVKDFSIYEYYFPIIVIVMEFLFILTRRIDLG